MKSISIQRTLRTAALLILSFSLGSGQTFFLQPPVGVVSRSYTGPKLFFHPDSGILLIWNKNINALNVQLKIGGRSGIYDLAQSSIPALGVPVTGSPGQYLMRFVPNAIGLSTGRYYAILTNSTQNTLGAIQSDAGKEYSNEVQFIVESQTAPVCSYPQGTITTSTPLFQWSSVPGVPAYWLLLSSTPFQVTKDSLGNVSVKGANLVWNFITSATSARYGDANPLNPFSSPAVPLLAGSTYNYVVLNMYEANNPVYASSQIAGVSSFVYQTSFQSAAPTLVAPANGALISGDQVITFRWNPVSGANDYILSLFNRLSTFAGSNQEIDLPIWSTTTTSTLADFPARTKLTKGRYVWRVIPRDQTGSGASSPTFVFDYVVPTGTFIAEAHSTTDNSSVIGYQLTATSISGGVTPANPFLVLDNKVYTDSIVTGTYLFTAKKAGYADSSTVAVISTSSTLSNPTRVIISLRPLPALISGVVRDAAGSAIGDASVRLVNIQTASALTQSTSPTGEYTFSVPTGSYTLQANKPGYLSSSPVTVTVGSGQTNVAPLRITLDATYLSGKVVNDEGQAVQLATVSAHQGSVVQEVTTTGEGTYQFTLSSGSWKISASKTGFISSAPATYNLAAGDNLTDQIFTLIPHANQIGGTVTSIVISAGGQRSTVGTENITVTATSSLGQPFTTTTNTNGEYTLSLKQGSYTITAAKTGYTSSRNYVVTLTMAQSVAGFDFTLTPHPSSVSGLVTLPDGTGLENATVSVQGVSTTQSISGGSYTLSLPPGTFDVSVVMAGYVSPTPLRISLSPGQTLNGISFQLTPNAGVIAGSVLSRGQPLSGATVIAASGPSNHTAQTSSDGSYVFSVDPGSWTLQASGAGFLTSAPRVVVVGAGQQSNNNDFSLVQNTAQVVGTVTDGTAPLRGATITLSDTATGAAFIVSNVQGSFAATVPAGTSYAVTISLDGYETALRSTGVLAASTTATIDVILLRNLSSISGHVLTTTRQPLPNATLTVYSAAGAVTNTGSSGFDGAYTIGVRAGTSRIVASLAGYRKDSISTTLGVGQSLSNIDLQLAGNFASVSGSVQNPATGIGVANALVDFQSPQGGATVVTGVDGNYVVQSLIGGTYRMRCTRTGFSDTTNNAIVIADGQSLTLNIPLVRLNGVVRGRVLQRNSTSVEAATVVAEFSGGSSQTTVTDNSGNFSIASLREGSYSLSAVKGGMRSSQKPAFRITATDSLLTVNITDMVLNTTGVRGTVVDSATRSPLSDVSLTVSGSLGSGSGVSGAGGQFTIQDLIPGNYTLSAIKNGFAGKSSTLTIPDTGQVTVLIALASHAGSISGRVTDLAGNPLKVTVPLRASSSTNSYTTTAGAQGNFTFTNVASDTGYTVATELARVEYTNAVLRGISVSGSATTAIGAVIVQVTMSQIQGTVGAQQATVELVDASSSVMKVVQSQPDGHYSFSYLAPGALVVRPRKSGYAFTPTQRSLTLGVSDTQTVSFSATSNVGKIRVTARSDLSRVLSGVAVSAVSADNSVVLNGITDQSGIYQFSDAPANTYTVSASLSGYSATPASQSVTLKARDSLGITLSMSALIARLGGSTFANIGGTLTSLDNVDVQARRYGTGEVFRTVSNLSGVYQLASLPRDSFLVIASRSGYASDSTIVSLKLEDVSARNFTLRPSYASLAGAIRSRNASDLLGISITASSALATMSITSDPTGAFRFNGLPIRTGAADTTYYLLSISKSGLSPQSQTVPIPSGKAAGLVTARDFILPNGSITVILSDGISPLAGIDVAVTKPDGSQFQRATSANGRFFAGGNLIAGSYRLAIATSGYLMPDPRLMSITLTTDTSVVTRTLKLPYMLVPLASIDADAAATVSVAFKPGFNAAKTTGKLYYKRVSQPSYTEAAMVVSDTLVRGTIPAQNSVEKLSYYVVVADDTLLYTAPQNELIPLASGMLSSVAFSPEINNLNLRLGESYALELIIRDGVQKSLIAKFVGSSATGRIAWVVPAGLLLSFPAAGDSTKATLKAVQTGAYSVKVTAISEGVSITRAAAVTVSAASLQSFTIVAPPQKMSNRSSGIQLSCSGRDSTGRGLALGSSLIWSADPPDAVAASAAVQFARNGFFKPADSTFIGLVTVAARDSVSGRQSSASLLVYAEVDPSQSYSLTDKRGMVLSIPKGAVRAPIHLELRNSTAGSVKKTSLPRGRTLKYTSSDQLYNFSYSASVALRGDTLQKTATLDIPLDRSLRFFGGEKSIAHYDANELEWVLLTSVASNSGPAALRSSSVVDFGEYAILSAEEPLKLTYVSVLPSPFSPEVAPLKIGYLLTSASPPAMVTVKIVNIRGELIRTVFENDVQFPGRYGSRSSNKEITWNGLTDDGRAARNGRYIIQIVAKDGTKEVSELIPVVLIR